MKFTLAIALLVSASEAVVQRSSFEPTETYTNTHRQKNLNEPSNLGSTGMAYGAFCRDGNYRATPCKQVCRDAAGVQHKCLETNSEYQHITRSGPNTPANA